MSHALEEMREELPLPSSPTGPSRPRRCPRARANAAVAQEICCDLLYRLAADPPHPPRYYLALRGGNPDAALVRRLQAIVPGIAPRSQCQVSMRAVVIDRATEVAGVIKDDAHVEADQPVE